MRTYLLTIALLVLTACGGQPTQFIQVPVPAATPSIELPDAASQLLSDIKALVEDENEYRQGLGQTELTAGLSCTLYKITGGQFIQNDSSHTPTLTGVTSAASFRFMGSFNQENSSVNDGLNVLPASIRQNPIYKNLIMLRCQGQVVVTETGLYDFDLASDDGSVLYLDGSRLIDNDGNHGITQKRGTKYLRRGVHAFRLDFAQTGSGAQALVLKANDSIIDGMFWFH